MLVGTAGIWRSSAQVIITAKCLKFSAHILLCRFPLPYNLTRFPGPDGMDIPQLIDGAVPVLTADSFPGSFPFFLPPIDAQQ